MSKQSRKDGHETAVQGFSTTHPSRSAALKRACRVSKVSFAFFDQTSVVGPQLGASVCIARDPRSLMSRNHNPEITSTQ